MRQFSEQPVLLWAGVIAGIASAFSMSWFYQGLERMRTSSSIDVASRAVGTFGVFLLVHSPAHAWRVLGIQAFASLVGSSVLLVMAYREIPFQWPSAAGTWDALRAGGSMFLFRSAVSLYTTANALILGLFASVISVGYYAGAEKLVRASMGLFSPLSQSMFPRLNYLLQHSQERAVRLLRISIAVMVVCSLSLMLVLWIGAPHIVRVILGPGFAPAVPVLRVLSVLLPTVALSNVFGIQWMLPLGLDRAFNAIIITCGLLNLGAAVLLAPRFGHLGVAFSVAGCECVVTVAMFVYLTRKHLNPFAHPERLSESVRQLQAAQAALAPESA
jgi:PST family polysaccharide transporter